MSPAAYSLAVLSSNRLRFADRLQWWGSFRLRSTGKTSQPSAGGRWCRRQNRQKCGRFIPALTPVSATIFHRLTGKNRPRQTTKVGRRYYSHTSRPKESEISWKLDRFGRSLLNCKTALQQLQSHGVRFIATT